MLKYMNMINNFLLVKEWLKGKKTYIACAIAAVVFFGHLVGWISTDVANQIYIVLGITGVGTVSAKIDRTLS